MQILSSGDKFHCPKCGSYHLHQEEVIVNTRREDDKALSVKCAVDQVVTKYTDDVPGRRSSVIINFSCEGCGDGYKHALSIIQHKGNTIVKWS